MFVSCQNKDFKFTKSSFQEYLTGFILIDCKHDCKHEEIILCVDAQVNMQISSKNVGVFEAFYNSAKVRFSKSSSSCELIFVLLFCQPIPLISQFVEISKGGKLPAGRTEIPFQVLLKAQPYQTLYESYHGVFITIQVM